MSKIMTAKGAAEQALTLELERATAWQRNGWRLFAGVVLVFGYQARDFKALVEAPSSWVRILLFLSLAVLGVALILSLRGLLVVDPVSYPRGEKLWDNLKPDSVSESAAEEAAVLLLLHAREQIARSNNARSRIVSWSGWALGIGILSVVACQLLDAFVDWT